MCIRDRARLGNNFIDRVNRMLKEKNIHGSIKFSDKPDKIEDIGGGFILRSGDIETNNSCLLYTSESKRSRCFVSLSRTVVLNSISSAPRCTVGSIPDSIMIRAHMAVQVDLPFVPLMLITRSNSRLIAPRKICLLYTSRCV